MWSFYYNTGRLSNAMAYWIGISPPDLFMYGFLPPLLLNSSLRIDFFLFKKVLLSVRRRRLCLPARIHSHTHRSAVGRGPAAPHGHAGRQMAAGRDLGRPVQLLRRR